MFDLGKIQFRTCIENAIELGLNLSDIDLPVIQDLIGTESSHEFVITFTACSHNYSTDRFGHLHGKTSHSTGCSVNQYTLACQKLGMLIKGLVGSQAGNGNRCSIGKTQMLRFQSCFRLLDQGELGITPELICQWISQAKHFVTHLEFRHSIADLNDYSSQINAQHAWKLPWNNEFQVAPANLIVDWI